MHPQTPKSKTQLGRQEGGKAEVLRWNVREKRKDYIQVQRSVSIYVTVNECLSVKFGENFFSIIVAISSVSSQRCLALVSFLK